MPEVNIQHLDKIYDGGVQAVYDFNLDVKDGDRFGRPFRLRQINHLAYGCRS